MNVIEQAIADLREKVTTINTALTALEYASALRLGWTDVAAPLDTRPLPRTPSRAKPAQKRKAEKRGGAAPRGANSRDARSLVIAALTKAAKPLSRPDLIVATNLTGPEIQGVLKRLTREKQVVQSGARRHFRWAIAPTPHTRAVAHAAGPEMEVVFDGSRGQSLSSYQQKPRG